MKFLKPFLSICLLQIFIFACSTKVKNLDTPAGTFSEAERLMEDRFFEEAREQYFRIKTEFPNSEFLAKADLRIADSYFEDDSWPAAASAYDDFLRTYPRHPEVPYALYRMGISYTKQMPSNPQRDGQGTQKAINTFTRLLVDFPSSEYTEEAVRQVERAQLLLAKKSYEIARFYEKKNHYQAAANRYLEVIELFPESPLVEESFARRIRMLRKAEKTEEADNLAQSFEQEYPNSEFTSMIQP